MVSTLLALGGWVRLMGFICLPRSASRDFPSSPWKGEEDLELGPPVRVEIGFHALEENEGCGSLCGNFLVNEVVVAEVDGPLLLMSADCGRGSRGIREDELVDGILRSRSPARGIAGPIEARASLQVAVLGPSHGQRRPCQVVAQLVVPYPRPPWVRGIRLAAVGALRKLAPSVDFGPDFQFSEDRVVGRCIRFTTRESVAGIVTEYRFEGVIDWNSHIEGALAGSGPQTCILEGTFEDARRAFGT